MKKSLYWILFAVIFIILTTLTVLCFITGAYFTGSTCLIGLGFVTYAILDTIAFLWKYSPKVANKFIFTCPKCEHKFVPGFWRWISVPHIFSKRYFKCDRCRHYSWMRRK